MKQDIILQRLISFPYLLCFLLFLFPLLTVSCADKVIEPTAYELASGIDIGSILSEKERTFLEAGTELKNYQAEVLYLIFLEIFLAAVFAFISPIGSCGFGLAALIALWFFIYQIPTFFVKSGLTFITVKPGLGAYAVSMMLIIGIASSIAAIVRRYRKKKESAESFEDSI